VYDAVLAETIQFVGAGGDVIEGYYARPMSPGSRGAVVVVHHLPGYDRATKEITRRFAVEGYNALCPNLYSREAPGASPDDAAAAVRAMGGVPDARFVADADAAAGFLRSAVTSNGRVGIIGFCSGGRQSVLAACSITLDAAVDCYGGVVVGEAPARVAGLFRPLYDVLPNLACPLLGIFGEEDPQPAPAHVAELAGILTEHGKDFEFHSFPAGHGFLSVDRPNYRPLPAVEAWSAILDFYARHLS
jgi:carboxymethylenebutenolidase